MEDEVPNIMYMLTGSVIPNLDVFFGADICNNSNKETDVKDIVVDEISELIKRHELFNFQREGGVNYITMFHPQQTSWTKQGVTEVLLNKLFKLSAKATHETPTTLVVLDRPLDADRALELLEGLKEVAYKLNALDCFIKVQFALLGRKTLHKV